MCAVLCISYSSIKLLNENNINFKSEFDTIKNHEPSSNGHQVYESVFKFVNRELDALKTLVFLLAGPA